MKLRMFSSVFGALFLATVLPACAVAQAYDPGTQDVDPPGRVLRVDLVDGSAALRLAGDEAWVGDVVNRPLTGGDQVWVEDNSRAELHVGATAVRLGARTGLAVVAVDDSQVQLRLNAGSAVVRVRALGPDERFEVQTPMYTAALRAAGEYRFDVNDAGNLTLVAVRAGQADVYAGSRYYSVGAGQRGAFDGNTGSAEIDPVAGEDALDAWADQRDAREDSSQAARYVSRDVTGYEALDGYGTWVSEPDYGYVWMPTVAVGWTPFYYGHWVYVSPWGWTWIDDAPWGFAPSHYGRWVSLGGRWGWMPGPRTGGRPMYAPAVVAWIGNPGPGRVGWMPLGPRDVYVPPYRVSDGYARRVNQANAPVQAAVIDNYLRSRRSNLDRPRHYAHEGITGAIVTMNQDAFASARPVQKNLQPFNGRSVQVGVPAAGFAPPRPTERSFGRPVSQAPRDVPPLVQRSLNTPLRRPAQVPQQVPQQAQPQQQPPQQQSGAREPVLQQRDRPVQQRPVPAWQPPARVEQRPRVEQPPVQLQPQQPRVQQPERAQQPQPQFQPQQQARPEQQRPQQQQRPQPQQQPQRQQPQRPQPQSGMIQREVKKDKDRERE